MSKIDIEKQVKIPGGAKGDLLAGLASGVIDNLTVGTNGQVLTANSGATHGINWAAPAVASVFSRTGAIVAATSDYDAVQIDFTPAGAIAATNVQAALEELDTEKSATSHSHTVDGLTDAVITSVADGQVLTYDSVSGNWVNEAPTGGISDPGSNGLLARTALNTTAARTIVDAGSSRVTITNGNGVSGNPTLDIAEANLDHANIGGTTPIANGGTGQTTQTAGFDALAPTTTKGDVIAHNGSDNVRVAVGSDGQALVSRSSASNGVAWETIGGSVPGGTQGQKLSFGQANVLSARDWMVLAEDYGAVGDGSTDDTAAILSALAAIINTGKTLWLSKTYKITSSLSISGENFTLDGGGTLAAHFAAASSEDIIRINAGGTGTTTGFNETLSKAAAPYTILKDVDVDSATGFTVGDYVQLLFNDSTDVFSQFTILRNISSNTFTFDDPILIPVDATQASTVLEQAVRRRIVIRNLKFTGSNSPSATVARAIRATSLVDSTIENCQFFDFTVSAAINVDLGYNCRFDGIYMENCGGNESDLQCQNFSNSFFDNFMSVNASGFGPQLIRATNCKVGKINSTGAQSRAIKIQGCTWNHFESLTASKSQTGTGLSISNACYSNIIEKVIAHDNADQGVWFSGERNLYNRIEYAQALGNDVDSSAVDISLSSGDESNHIILSDYLSGSQQVNGANSITRKTGIHTYDSAAVTVASTASETLLKFIRFPANSLRAGTILRITAAGRYSTANASDSVGLTFRLSGTGYAGPISTQLATTTSDHWSVESLVHIVSVGGSGTFDAISKFQYRNGAATLVDAHTTRTHNTVTIDTTASRDFEITATWSNALAGNTITCETFIVERLN